MLSSTQIKTKDLTILNNIGVPEKLSKCEKFVTTPIDDINDRYDSFGNTLQDNSSSDESCTFGENDSESEDSGIFSSINNAFINNNSATSSSSHSMQLKQSDYSEPSGQCRLLLVSLLDNFCSLYDRNPLKNQKLFSSLCRKLCSMGILKSLDFIEESRPIRSVYREAFKAIVVEAVKSIESTDFKDIELNLNSSNFFTSNSKDDISFNSSENRESALQATHTFTHLFNNSSESSVPIASFGEEIFLSGRSRYKEDFIEGGILGRGGYGKVVIAANKLDGTHYAIKKIHFTGVSSVRFARILREVKSLARLDHPNIVRYNSAWIEDHSVITETIENIIEDSNRNNKIIHELEVVKHNFSNSEQERETMMSNVMNSLAVEDDEDTFTSGMSSNSNVDKTNAYSKTSSSYECTHVLHLSNSHSNTNMHSRQLSDPSRPHHHRFHFKDRKIMYIQMELCQFTLDQYIKARNAFYFRYSERFNNKFSSIVAEEERKLFLHDKSERSHGIPIEKLFLFSQNLKQISLNPVELDSIFKGIVKGLNYIHENGMIHRDLKPMNIFFHTDLKPKIGDFGLVSEMKCSCGYNCSVTDTADSLESSSTGVSSSGTITPTGSSFPHTKGVGTATYASPEQLNQGDYSQKSDIYSLGIICFELFYPVATQMERTRVLTDLKQHHKFPESFLKQWPKEAAFIWSCIARDATVRPTTTEILESEWLERDHEEIISRLESELSAARKREEDLLKLIEEIKQENYDLKQNKQKINPVLN